GITGQDHTMIQALNRTIFYQFVTYQSKNFVITRHDNFGQLNPADGLWSINSLKLNHMIGLDHLKIDTAIQQFQAFSFLGRGLQYRCNITGHMLATTLEGMR